MWHDAAVNMKQFDSNGQQPQAQMGSHKTNEFKTCGNENVCLKEAALTCVKGNDIKVTVIKCVRKTMLAAKLRKSNMHRRTLARNAPRAFHQDTSVVNEVDQISF